MSSLLTETARALGLTDAAGGVRSLVALVAIAVLLVILVAREMARTGLSGPPHRRAERLGFAVVPLSLIFAGAIAPRVWELLT